MSHPLPPTLARLLEAEFAIPGDLLLEVRSRDQSDLLAWLSDQVPVLGRPGFSLNPTPARVESNILLAARLLCLCRLSEAGALHAASGVAVPDAALAATLRDRLSQAYREALPGSTGFTPSLGIFVDRGGDLGLLCRPFCLTPPMANPVASFDPAAALSMALMAGSGLVATGDAEHFPVAAWLAVETFIAEPGVDLNPEALARAALGSTGPLRRMVLVEVATWGGDTASTLIPVSMADGYLTLTDEPPESLAGFGGIGPLAGLDVSGVSPLLISASGLTQRTLLARYFRDMLGISSSWLVKA